MENLVIQYSKGDRYYKCYIHGALGTSYDHLHSTNSELHAQYPNQESSCVSYAPKGSGETNPDTYVIYPGNTTFSTENNGHIQINVRY